MRLPASEQGIACIYIGSCEQRKEYIVELKGKWVAVLAENSYEDLELWYPVLRLREAGAKVTVVGMPGVEEYTSKHGYPV